LKVLPMDWQPLLYGMEQLEYNPERYQWKADHGYCRCYGEFRDVRRRVEYLVLDDAWMAAETQGKK
jgi:hypothetical protein